MSNQLSTGSARRVTLDVGRPVAALQAGSAHDPAALLVPGYTGSKEDFAPLLDPLAAAGYHVTAIDLPGQFESPGLARSADYTTGALGSIVADVCAALGPRVRLLGHSFGGLVARATVLAVPSRIGSLVLLSSGPAELGGSRRASIEQLEPVLAGSGPAGVYAAMQAAAMTEPGFTPPPPELAEFLRRRFLGGSPAMLQGMGDALRREPDRVAELAATEVPVLVVHGVDDDAWEPSAQQQMARRLGAQYVVVPDAAHSAAVENTPALVHALLEFWQATDRTR